MSRLRLLVAEKTDFSEAAGSLLRQHFDVSWQDLDRAGLIGQLPDFDLLWVRLRSHIDEEVISNGRKLQAIATNTTGLTHIDLEAAQAKGIEVVSLRGEEEFLRDIRATAEHTIGLTLSLLRSIPSAVQSVQRGEWDRSLFRGHEIYKTVVGIVGYGRLGQLVARYFQSMGATVLLNSRDLDIGTRVDGMDVLSLDDLLRKSRVVSVHVSFEESNRKMFGGAQFDAMQSGGYFINTSRGELVDESALLDALRLGNLAGAAIDVIDREHEQTSTRDELIQHSKDSDRLIITPHIGGNTVESTERTEEFLAEKLVSRFTNR